MTRRGRSIQVKIPSQSKRSAVRVDGKGGTCRVGGGGVVHASEGGICISVCGSIPKPTDRRIDPKTTPRPPSGTRQSTCQRVSTDHDWRSIAGGRRRRRTCFEGPVVTSGREERSIFVCDRPAGYFFRSLGWRERGPLPPLTLYMVEFMRVYGVKARDRSMGRARRSCPGLGKKKRLGPPVGPCIQSKLAFGERSLGSLDFSRLAPSASF